MDQQDQRPLDVTLVSVYFIVFSATLIGLLVWQIAAHRIHAPWKEQIFVLPVCFLIALIPAVLALGLWVQDNAARLGAILFVLLHTVTEIVWFNTPRIPSKAFTAFRLLLNVAILISLTRPGVKKAFRWEPVDISLRDRGSA